MRIDDARRLASVSPPLAAAYLETCQRFACKFPGQILGVAQGYRTPSAQSIAAANGKSQADGTIKFSYHQMFPSMALDFAVLEKPGPDGYVENGADERYRWVGEAFEGLGFRWGGRWPDPDWDHVYVPGPSPDRDAVLASHEAYLSTLRTAPFYRV